MGGDSPDVRWRPWHAPRAAYLHVPFCRTKCLYCAFNTFAGKERLLGEYVAALATEIRRRAAAGGASPAGALQTVYFGGGTPSLLPLGAARRLMAELRAAFGVSPGAEVTLEANPGTFGPHYLAGLQAQGINRLSLGVQSLDDETLRRLARTHDAAGALAAVRLARAAGIASLSLDLIYGLPWQTVPSWLEGLSRALDAEPDHISLYALMVEEGTPLATLVRKGAWTVPDDDAVADMYEAALPVLERAGYVHYEVSNWARPAHASRHNLVYWRNEAYLGFGAGAHAYVAGRRSWNVKPIEAYLRRIARREDPTEGEETLGREAQIGETAALALRLRQEGIDGRRFRERFGIEPRERWGEVLRDLEGSGLLRVTGERITLTDRALLVSNAIAARFLGS